MIVGNTMPAYNYSYILMSNIISIKRKFNIFRKNNIFKIKLHGKQG
jgi:hypothetical protein